MNNKNSIKEILKELKNNIANQVDQEFIDQGNQKEVYDDPWSENTEEYGFREMHKNKNDMEYKKENEDSSKSLDGLKLSHLYRQKLSSIGIEMVVSTCVSYGMAWGIGHLFTLSSFWRIILGTLLAFAVNALAVYRIIMR